MRKAENKGDFVEVTDPNLVYPDLLDDKGKALGADPKKWFPKTLQMKMQGTVLGREEGYVLLDIEGGHYLVDADAIKPAIKPADMKFLVQFVSRNAWEQFDTEASIKTRIIDLIKQQALKFGDEIKVYELTSVKTLKFDLSVFLG